MTELTGAERIILAIDTSDTDRAQHLARVALEAGARYVKMGLELQSATSWRYCADLAADHEVGWVADAKLDDVPNTVVAAVRNIVTLPRPPIGITMHTTAGHEAMYRAQQAAGPVKMLGVTVLTSISDPECARTFGAPRREKVMELATNAAEANLLGVVASPREVGMIKEDPATAGLFAMIPGVRPAGAESHDQAAIGTPGMTVLAGADLLVIGRPITEASDPAEAFATIAFEIEEALRGRP